MYSVRKLTEKNLFRDFDITWSDNVNVTEPPKVENEEVSHGFMDSLLYVMIPSLLSFFALFWAFYALHSYTVDTKVVSQLYQRMKESRNSIRQKFTNSGLGSKNLTLTSIWCVTKLVHGQMNSRHIRHHNLVHKVKTIHWKLN